MKELHDKLVKIQSELKAPKNQRNNFGGYNYRSAEDILEAVKPLLNKHGLTLTISDNIDHMGDRYYVTALCDLSDGEHHITVSGVAREAEDRKGMDASQITGAASSYARKYAMNGLFAIDDTKDADATNTHDSEPSKPVKASSNKEMSAKQRQLINDKLKSYYVESTNRAGFIEHIAGMPPAEMTSADASELIDMLINEEEHVKNELTQFRLTL